MDKNRLDALLFLWSEQQISEQELAELNELLKDGQNRTYAYSFFHLTSTITDALKESSAGTLPALNEAAGRQAPLKFRSARRAPKSRFGVAAYVVAASILFCIGAFVWMNWPGESSVAKVETALSGGLVWRNGISKPVVAGMALFTNDRIVNSSLGTLAIKYMKEDTELQLFPQTELNLAAQDGQKQLSLKSGKMSSKVAKQPMGKPLLLETPYATATVLGTQFVISVAASDSVLDVSEGAVRFHNKSSSVEVTAGQSAVASANGIVNFNVAPGLIGTYFSDMELTPANQRLQRVDAKLDFDWDKVAPAPGMSREGFSVRWTGVLKAPTTGRYMLHVLSDDGCGIWIGNKQIMYKIIPKTPLVVDWSGPVDLEQGFQDIKVDYVQGAGGASIHLFWSKENEFTERLVPPEAFWHFGDIKK